MNCCRRLFATCLSLAVVPQLWIEPTAAQSRWSTNHPGSSWSQPSLHSGATAPNSGDGYRGRSGGYPQSSGRPGFSGGYHGGGYHGGGHHGGGHDDQPFDNLNLGILISPDWIGGWSGPANSAGGGYYAPGGEYSDQPVLNQPPFYSGQPAPNFYQVPPPVSAQSQYLTPRSGRSLPTPASSADASVAGARGAEPQPNNRRRSILVRPESAPTLSQTLAAGSPAASEYETSLTAFGMGEYQAALDAALAAAKADPANGKLQLYLAQCHFAVGEFEASAEALTNAFEQLPPDQWGLVIENFRQFYKRNDYVTQFNALLSFTDQPGQQQLGAALQAYHYRYLGHPDAAAEQLQVALKTSAPMPMVTALKSLVLTNQAGDGAPLPAPLAGN